MRLFIPATTTNFGSGFDTFGLALNLYNIFSVSEDTAFKVEIRGEGEDLPRDERNLTLRVYRRCCEIFGEKERPFKLFQENNVPVERGLGSSATAIVGGIKIFEKVHSKRIELETALKVAFEFESHPDNIVPALVGGFVICFLTEEGFKFKRLEFPRSLKLVFAVPDFRVSTEEARKVLPKEVGLSEAVFNVQRASLLVSALLTEDFDLIRSAVEDRLHQPYRGALIKGFERVREAGYRGGAYGVFISGSGPTVCAISPADRAKRVAELMKEAFEAEGAKAKTYILEASERGSFWS